MDEKIEKLIKHQVTSEVSEAEMCDSIGITRMTYSNLKKGNMNPQVSTIEKIDAFIEENEL